MSSIPPEAIVFSFLVKIDRGLRKKIPIDTFKTELKNRYREVYPEAIFPDDVTLDHFYERLLDANAETHWVILAKKLSRSAAWKKHRNWTKAVIELACRIQIVLRASNPGFLPARQYNLAKSLSVSLRRLNRDLRELQRFDRRLDDVAKTRNWNSVLRTARVRLESLLRGKYRSLTREQGAELITMATELAGLKREESLEAVSRALRRARSAVKHSSVHPSSRPSSG